MAIRGEVTHRLSAKDLVSPCQAWHGESLSPIWCHLCLRRPRLPSSPRPAVGRCRGAMDAARSPCTVLGHVKPAPPPPECAKFRIAEVAPAHRTPRWWGCSNPQELGAASAPSPLLQMGKLRQGGRPVGCCPGGTPCVRAMLPAEGCPPKPSPWLRGEQLPKS